MIILSDSAELSFSLSNFFWDKLSGQSSEKKLMPQNDASVITKLGIARNISVNYFFKLNQEKKTFQYNVCRIFSGMTF